MNKKTKLLFQGLHVLVWIIFIGLCIEAGALIFNFTYSVIQPIAAHNIYKGLDLWTLQQEHFIHFFCLMNFIILITALKAYLFYLVVKMFKQLDLANPFHNAIALLINKISIEVFFIALIGVFAQQYSKQLAAWGYKISSANDYWIDNAAFFMMSAILFIIAQIFKRGIELQNESDLTV